MGNWSGLDFFIFLIFFLNTILGMSRGASKEIISLMCVSAGLIIAIKFTMPLTALMNHSPFIQDVIGSSSVQNFMASIGANALTVNALSDFSYCLSLLICFVGTFSATEAVLNVTGIAETYTFPYAALNRKIGGGLGCTRGYIFTLILILILQHLASNALQNSYFASLFGSTAVKLDSLIHDEQPDRYKELYQDKNKFNSTDVMNATQVE